MITRAVRRVLWSLRAGAIRARYAGVDIASGVAIGDGVTLKATDGGTLVLADGCVVENNATIIVKFGACRIGANVHVGIGAVITCRKEIEIGEGALIAEYVTIRDQDHAYRVDGPTRESGFSTAPVAIGRNVWLGAKVTVTKGVTIGDNVVVGANSVVTGDIPANAVAAGAPARVIRMIDAPA